MILPHQIIWLWIGISGLTGAIISLLVSEGKNPLYILANIFCCCFAGSLFGGIFVALTDALVWTFWSLLIPVFIGGIIAFVISIYLKDRIPKPDIKLKPLAVFLAVFMILIISIASALPLLAPKPMPNYDNITPSMVIDTEDAKILIPSFKQNAPKISAYSFGDYTVKLSLSDLLSTTNREGFVKIKGYKACIKFPTLMAENPQEGQYLGFKFLFSVPSTSPAPWSHPIWFLVIWGDTNNNGVYDADIDYVLDDYWYKIPSQGGAIITCSNCLYDENEDPLYAVTTTIPLTFAQWTVWKDDSQYTFYNTPELWTPPYDQTSFQLVEDEEGNYTAYYMESISYWIPINVGEGPYDVYGKLYCPYGMSDVASKWYITVIAYEPLYSETEPIAQYSLSFNIQSPQKPVVDISGSWWVETALFAIIAVACIAIIKYGGKWAFK